MLLQARDLIITVGARHLVENVSFEIHHGDRIGLIGKNGTGKSTLINVLIGNIPIEKGEITRSGIIEYVPQLKEQDAEKSGGEVTQQYIQRAFAKQAGLLIADEPTTHLDTNHIEWVEDTLKSWNGAYLIVSHDRAFLDATCNQIWEISDGKLHFYRGNYSSYKHQKESKEKQHQENYEKYLAKKKQLERALELRDQKAARATKKPKKTSNSEAKIIGAKPYFAKKQKKLHQTASALETRLDKLEKVAKPMEQKPLKMELPYEEKMANRTIIRLNNVMGKIGDKLLWENASFEVKTGEKIAITGPNGSGKTTLIRSILSRQDGITISDSCRIGYFKQDLSQLDSNLSILENVLATSNQTETLVRTVLARLYFRGEDVHKKISVLSGGEQVKVALAKIFVSNVNTLIFDEPTNFLDIDAVEALEQLLQEYEGTILFVSHDRRFVEQVASRVIEMKDKMLHDSDTMIEHKSEQSTTEEELLVIETKISDVLGRLSLEPTVELEEEFQQLLKKKKAAENTATKGE
ncbi:pleuromutilin/lincosamide/streptogramin A transport system ATP-binding/permease protein [Gracilibacillus halotolerans]|uniref:Pleuromutilin/lincosamide/streptogramin A transport system ATP-binding/permease protein n=1 Tax=Gracilibacillus halotolerans TaxID=74386 RepID=A0A841RRL0_9BACI|nr:ABC-F type ribosomal protection protein [Gracilibacillus halotolerans]MBB6513228.1 pleuromutilin/lincosamide/streptogramin A transport system ATP-binding/permease protein [Gracilibacillus halotolerans]